MSSARPGIPPRRAGLLAAALAAACAAAQRDVGPSASAGPPPAVAATPLERGLAAISPALVAEDVAFLAATELEGRDTPSPGLRIAARYIAERLERLGFEPGAPGGWFHEYELCLSACEPGRTALELTLSGETLDLSYGSDCAVHPTEVTECELAAELAWCGDGSREAFRGLDLGGRAALVLEGDEPRMRRRRLAAEAGAGALLVLADPRADGPPFADWIEAGPIARFCPEDAALPVFWLAGEPARRLRALGESLEPGAALDARVRASSSPTRVRVQNVCGYWPGSDPLLAGEVLLASAHYDHVGVEHGQVYCGADDNASGSAALLALAEALAEHGPLERSVLLLWVSGEELGLLGSRAWARDPWLPGGARVIANVNLDMVGRNAPELLEHTPSAAHPAYNRLAEQALRLAPLEGFSDLRSVDKEYGRSDHAAFAEELGIPVLYLSTGEHEDYHRPSDTADKIDAGKVARMTRLVLRLLVDASAAGV